MFATRTPVKKRPNTGNLSLEGQGATSAVETTGGRVTTRSVSSHLQDWEHKSLEDIPKPSTRAKVQREVEPSTSTGRTSPIRTRSTPPKPDCTPIPSVKAIAFAIENTPPPQGKSIRRSPRLNSTPAVNPASITKVIYPGEQGDITGDIPAENQTGNLNNSEIAESSEVSDTVSNKNSENGNKSAETVYIRDPLGEPVVEIIEVVPTTVQVVSTNLTKTTISSLKVVNTATLVATPTVTHTVASATTTTTTSQSLMDGSITTAAISTATSTGTIPKVTQSRLVSVEIPIELVQASRGRPEPLFEKPSTPKKLVPTKEQRLANYKEALDLSLIHI